MPAADCGLCACVSFPKWSPKPKASPASGRMSRNRDDLPGTPSAPSSRATVPPAVGEACVSGWLDAHGFSAYASAFAAHKVDSMDMLVLLSRSDLRHVTGVVGDAVRLHEVFRVKVALRVVNAAGLTIGCACGTGRR